MQAGVNESATACCMDDAPTCAPAPVDTPALRSAVQLQVHLPAARCCCCWTGWDEELGLGWLMEVVLRSAVKGRRAQCLQSPWQHCEAGLWYQVE